MNKKLNYLNFNRFLCNIATNLLGVFVPSIVYAYTNSIILAILMLLIPIICRPLLMIIFKNLLLKTPELCNILRVFFVVLKISSVALIDVNIYVSIGLILIFDSLNMLFKQVPNDIIFARNYNQDCKQKDIGYTNFFRYLGLSVAIMISGYLLDGINIVYIVIIAVILYLIASFPLVYLNYKEYKIKNYDKQKIKQIHNQIIDKFNQKLNDKTKKELRYFSILTACFNSSEAAESLLNLYLFVIIGSFSKVSYLISLSYLLKGLLSLFLKKIDVKELQNIAFVSMILMGVLIITAPFTIQLLSVYYVAYLLRAICYSVIELCLYSKFLTVATYNDCKDKSVYIRLNSIYAGNSWAMLIAMMSMHCAFYISGAVLICASPFLLKEHITDSYQNDKLNV